jgi:hypothetical protein
MAPGQDLSLASPHQSRSLRCDTSVEQKRIEDFQANRRTLRPPRYNGPPPAAATATRALLPALDDSDSLRFSFASHLRTAIDAKTSRRGMLHYATLRRNERRWLGTRTTATLFHPRLPLARPAQPGLPTSQSLPERERHNPSKSRQAGEQRRLCLGTTSWNHAFEERPLPAARSHLCAPEQRSGILRRRPRGAGRR